MGVFGNRSLRRRNIPSVTFKNYRKKRRQKKYLPKNLKNLKNLNHLKADRQAALGKAARGRRPPADDRLRQ
jgi:hypothetical protein